jgi:hypothetical protein
MYMVTEGTHVNNRCCFDYGNAETNNNDTGNGDMDAIYFGTLCWFSPCSGSNPKVMADLENGLFAGGNGSNTANTGRNSAFVTAMTKNNGTTTYAIKDGDAQSGGLATRWNGSLPTQSGYQPMTKQGGAKSVTFPASGSAYRLTNLASGKVLDAQNCGTANGTRVQMWMWLNNTCQLWSFSS